MSESEGEELCPGRKQIGSVFLVSAGHPGDCRERRAIDLDNLSRYEASSGNESEASRRQIYDSTWRRAWLCWIHPNMNHSFVLDAARSAPTQLAGGEVDQSA